MGLTFLFINIALGCFSGRRTGAGALELLGRADVVVVDALAPRDLLEDLDPGTEVIDAPSVAADTS